MATFSEIVQKKVFGIPVVYLGLAAALGLALLAWKIKPTAVAPDTAAPVEPEAEPDTSGLVTTGTVVVAPQDQPDVPVVQQTNEDWVRAGADYAANDAKVATYGDALAALTAYINGEDLSFDQGKIRDAVLSKLKAPPEPLGKIGITASQPAQKQFNEFPGKHTVKGANDNTPTKLATLYYGNSDANHVNLIVSANYNLGPATTTYNPGTVISIPKWTTPRYFVVTKGKEYPTTIAGLNGVSYAQIIGLNPSIVFPAKDGTKVRVA